MPLWMKVTLLALACPVANAAACSSIGVTSTSDCSAQCGGSYSWRSVNGADSCTCSTGTVVCSGGSSSGNNNAQGVVSLSVISPTSCNDASDCNYICAEGYTVTQIGSDITLTSTYSGSSCTCYSGTGTVSGDSASGSFANGAVPFSSGVVNSKIMVTTTVEGLACAGTYDIESGTVLGITPPANAGAQAAVTAAAVVAAWGLYAMF